MACCDKPIEDVTVISQLDITESSMSELEFYSNKEINSQYRLDICKGCDQLITPINVCKSCGCFMNIKIRIYSATCPLKKW